MSLGLVAALRVVCQMSFSSFSLAAFARGMGVARKGLRIRGAGLLGVVAIFMGAGTLAGAQTATVGGNWVQQSPASSPPPR